MVAASWSRTDIQKHAAIPQPGRVPMALFQWGGAGVFLFLAAVAALVWILIQQDSQS